MMAFNDNNFVKIIILKNIFCQILIKLKIFIQNKKGHNYTYNFNLYYTFSDNTDFWLITFYLLLIHFTVDSYLNLVSYLLNCPKGLSTIIESIYSILLSFTTLFCIN